MKRSAERWIDLLDNGALLRDDCRDLAQLLRAMVAEREALYAALHKWPAEIEYPATESERVMAGRTARRRAEGEE